MTQITETPDGGDPHVTTLDYDPAGRLAEIVDPLGRITSHGYDAIGRQISLTLPHPDGGDPSEAPEFEYAFDPLGRIIQQIDPLGNETTWAYEDFGHRVITTYPDPDGAGPLESPVTIAEYNAKSILSRSVNWQTKHLPKLESRRLHLWSIN